MGTWTLFNDQKCTPFFLLSFDSLKMADRSGDSSEHNVSDAEKSPLDTPDQIKGEESDFPEGGARAWSVAIGASGVMFSTFGYVNAFG